METEAESKEEKRTIKHIVLSGGGETGFAFYGALRESNKQGFWDIQHIRSIHSTSVGSIFGVCLTFSHLIGWDKLDNFIYNRPWDQVYKFGLNQIINVYSNIGVLDRKAVYDTLYPLFTAIDISMDVTMEEFYKLNGIELHLYTTEMESFQLIDVSYKTHPHWKVIDAVYASCSLPLLFKPAVIEGKSYIDGAVFCNYPLKPCMEMADHEDEIFAFRKVYPIEDKTDPNYENLIDYINDILAKMVSKISTFSHTPDIKNCLKFLGESTSVYTVYKVMSDHETRNHTITYGTEVWNEFYQNL